MRTRLGHEAAFTLIELIVVMAILTVVVSGITLSFTSASRSEISVSHRQQSQSDARQALTRMRQDIHCSYYVQSVAPNRDSLGNVVPGFSLSLTELANQCAAVDTAAGGVSCGPGATSSCVFLRWCTIPDPNDPGTFNLYRNNSTCDGTVGTRVATGIVAPQGGWPANTAITPTPASFAGNIWPTSRGCTTGFLPTQAVDLAVNPDSAHAPKAAYELKDEIALRNALRGSACSGTSGTFQLVSSPATPTAGTPFTVTITAKKLDGTTDTSYAGVKCVTFSGASNSPNNNAPVYPAVGGCVSGQSEVTFGGGVATASVTLYNAAATNLAATEGSVTGTSTSFNVNPTAATAVSKTAGDAQSANKNAAFAIPLKVTATDTYGNSVPGTAITFSAPTSGASGAFAAAGCSGNPPATTCIVTTAADGTATATTFTANGTAGAYNVTAKGASTNTVSFGLSNIAVAPQLVSLQMLDVDQDGKVDRVVATFDSALAACTAPCTTGWTLANVPSAGTLNTVTIAGSVATLNITEGAGAVDTAVNTFTVALAASSGITDTTGTKHSAFVATAPSDGAAPIPVTVVDTNGATDGKFEAGDTLTVTFSEAITGLAATSNVSLVGGNGSGSESLTMSNLLNGTAPLSNGYISGNGSTANFNNSALSQPAANQVRVTLGACTGACASLTAIGAAGNFVYTPVASIKDVAANAATGSTTVSVKLF